MTNQATWSSTIVRRWSEITAATKDARPEEQERLLREGLGSLRTCYEAFIIFNVLNEVVLRWGERISFGRLKGIVWDQALVIDIIDSCERLSRYIEGHLHSDAFAGQRPTLQLLIHEIEHFDGLRKHHSKLRKQPKT